jgi:uncharacterized protein YgbK (DUF1537 family)
MTNCLILADDLSGAADSAVSALQAGLDAEVSLTADGAEQSRTAVVAIDLNSREIEEERARTLTLKTLEKIHPRTDLFLYRKIDSTLRGHVAVELAATRAAASKRFILFAPAFPANRRITVGGKILVDGERSTKSVCRVGWARQAIIQTLSRGRSYDSSATAAK